MIEKDQPPLEDNQRSGLSKGGPQQPDEADPTLLVRPEVRPGMFPGNERTSGRTSRVGSASTGCCGPPLLKPLR